MGGGIKERYVSYNHFLMCTHSLDCSAMFMELYREERRERKETEVAAG